MNIFFIVLWLFLIIFVLPLFLPLKIEVTYDNTVPRFVILKLQVLFFKFKINKSLNKKNTKPLNSNKKRNNKKITNNKNKIINQFKNMEWNEYYLLIQKITSVLTEGIKKLLNHIVIENIYLYSIITGNEAAEIGIKYGKYNILVYNIYAILNKIFYIKNANIYLYPNFVNSESKTYFNIRLKFKPIIIIAILLAIILNFGIIICSKCKRLNKIKKV